MCYRCHKKTVVELTSQGTDRKNTMIYILLVFLAISRFSMAAIDPNCDFYQNMVMGQEYYLYNQEYPAFYSKSTACRWVGRSPPGTIIVVTCNDIELPSSRYCQRDRLVFSPEGNEDLENDDNVEEYCGQTSFTTFSMTNMMSLGLFAPTDTTRGRFLCTLAAMYPAPNTCNCGIHNEMRIVGGTAAGLHEYPAIAALVDVQNNENVFCGGTIITNRYILTAAHCLLHQTVDNLRVLVGEHDLRTIESGTEKYYRVESFYQHFGYDDQTHLNDIAVVKTTQNIQYNVGVQPACLPFKYRQFNFEREVVTALGWGFQDFSGDKAAVLQKVNLNIVTNQECDAANTEDIQSTQICTYASGKDSCISDSGGPLFWDDRFSGSGKTYLIGIISFGFSCASNRPAVNTRVTSYLSWIASVTSDTAYCIK